MSLWELFGCPHETEFFSTLSAFLDDLTKRNAQGFDYSAFERGARYLNTRQRSLRQLHSQVYTGSVGAENFPYFAEGLGTAFLLAAVVGWGMNPRRADHAASR